jgi:pre-mRNA-splicing factor SPF27
MEIEGQRSAKRKRVEENVEEEHTAAAPDETQKAQIGEATSNEPLLLDVLPYVDPYSEEEKQAALRLIQEEMATFQPPDYLATTLPSPPLPSFLGGTEALLQAEMERVGAGKPPVGGFDATRYALRRPQGAEEKDPEAWDKAIDQAQMVLQHQHARLANLRLLEQFGPGAWLTNNQRLQSVQKQLDDELRAVRAQIEELNRKRLEEQQTAGVRLYRSQTEWAELVQKNMQLGAACLQLEHSLPSRPTPTDEDGGAM